MVQSAQPQSASPSFFLKKQHGHVLCLHYYSTLPTLSKKAYMCACSHWLAKLVCQAEGGERSVLQKQPCFFVQQLLKMFCVNFLCIILNAQTERHWPQHSVLCQWHPGWSGEPRCCTVYTPAQTWCRLWRGLGQFGCLPWNTNLSVKPQAHYYYSLSLELLFQWVGIACFLEHVIQRLRVQIPAEAVGEFSSPESTLCADSYLVSVLPPCYCSGT